MTEPTTDRFELAGRNWVSQEETIEHARKQTRIYDLNPELVEGLLHAYRRQDLAEWEKALAGFLRAVAEANEKKAAATD